MKTATMMALALALELGMAGISHASSKRSFRRTGHLLIAQASPTQAAPQVPTPTRIEVFVLQGSNGPDGIAPELQQFSTLRRPPFTSYSQITVVSSQTLPLGNAPITVTLPGGNASIYWNDHANGRVNHGRYALSVDVRLNNHTHHIQFAATPGDPFFNVLATPAATSALILGFVLR